MRLRIRILLLTIALLCGVTSTASACLPPILNPFCWLFGCGYGYGGYGHDYGYGHGYGHGYAANPQASYRVIDDWLGYGYLRNQEGTLGHYPGRPFSCYRPWFPGLFAPCPPPVPAFAMPGPMLAPMPTMHNPSWNPCQDQCADPCLPSPMVQCQPAPVPVTTWRPVTVDQGNWQMVWVPRPVTTMVPQTQYVSPPSMMDSGCGNDCFGNGGDMLQGMMPGMSSGDGCCGSEGIMQQQAPYPGMPQSTMMSPGNMSMTPQFGMSPHSSMNRWTPSQGAMAWSPLGPSATGGYPVSAYNNPWPSQPMRPGMVRRQMQRTAMQYRQFNGQFTQSADPYLARNMMPGSQPMPSRVAYAQPMYSTFAYGQPMNAQPMNAQPMNAQQAYSQPQQFAWQAAPMTAQWAPQPSAAAPAQMVWSMEGTASPGINVAGDVMGDHELIPLTTAALPVVPNSFSGPAPLTRANLSGSVQTLSANRYPNVIR